MKEMGVVHRGLRHSFGDAMLARIQADGDLDGCRLRTGDGIILR